MATATAKTRSARTTPPAEEQLFPDRNGVIKQTAARLLSAPRRVRRGVARGFRPAVTAFGIVSTPVLAAAALCVALMYLFTVAPMVGWFVVAAMGLAALASMVTIGTVFMSISTAMAPRVKATA